MTDSTDNFETSVSIKITGYHTLGYNTDMQVTQSLVITLAGEMSIMWRRNSELCLSRGDSEELKAHDQK